MEWSLNYLGLSFISPSILDGCCCCFSSFWLLLKHWIVTIRPKWRPFHDETDLSSELSSLKKLSKRVNISIVCLNVQNTVWKLCSFVVNFKKNPDQKRNQNRFIFGRFFGNSGSLWQDITKLTILWFFVIYEHVGNFGSITSWQ